MDTEKDEYLLLIRQDGTRIYYKNKTMHREDGPAIIPSKDTQQYTGLPDESLYAQVSEPESLDKFIVDQIILESQKTKFYFGVIYPLVRYSEPQYYLNGIKYTEKEFHSIRLKNKIEKELSQKETELKKTKV